MYIYISCFVSSVFLAPTQSSWEPALTSPPSLPRASAAASSRKRLQASQHTPHPPPRPPPPPQLSVTRIPPHVHAYEPPGPASHPQRTLRDIIKPHMQGCEAGHQPQGRWQSLQIVIVEPQSLKGGQKRYLPRNLQTSWGGLRVMTRWDGAWGAGRWRWAVTWRIWLNDASSSRSPRSCEIQVGRDAREFQVMVSFTSPLTAGVVQQQS